MLNGKEKWFLPALAVFLLVILWGRQVLPVVGSDDFAYIDDELGSESELQIADQEETYSQIVVHVAGAVKAPGVYTLEEGKRVEDVLQMAGVTDEADIDALNRAAVLSDGQKLVVPLKKEGDQRESIMQEETDGLVNLNQANLQQLMTLPGIGEVKAQAILEYRAQHGSFSSIEEIQQVSGIGEATYSQIKNKIKI